MTKKSGACALAATACLALVLPTVAACDSGEERLQSPSRWTTIGPAIGTEGVGGSVSFSWPSGSGAVTLRACGCGRTAGGVGDLGVLFGPAKLSDGAIKALGVGVALTECANARRLFAFPVITGGVAFQAMTFVRTWNTMGVGLYGFANINPDRPFAGVSVSIIGLKGTSSPGGPPAPDGGTQ